MLYRIKIKAFTLSETLVALVLMVIIVGLASSIINLTTTNIKLIQENENGYRDLEQLEFILELDISRNQKMTYSDSDSALWLKNRIDSIRYKFKQIEGEDNTAIIRNQDTITSQLLKTRFYHKGKAVNRGIIDAIEVINTKTKHSIFVYKPEDMYSRL